MIVAQHFGSISGGKDSQAVLCVMVEQIERKGLTAFGNRARASSPPTTGTKTRSRSTTSPISTTG